MNEDKEPKSLSIEQRNALDSIRHACKDGTISNVSLYYLLSNLKPVLELKNKSDKLVATIPEGIQSFLGVSSGDKLTWEPVIILEKNCVIITKKTSSAKVSKQ